MAQVWYCLQKNIFLDLVEFTVLWENMNEKIRAQYHERIPFYHNIYWGHCIGVQ